MKETRLLGLTSDEKMDGSDVPIVSKTAEAWDIHQRERQLDT